MTQELVLSNFSSCFKLKVRYHPFRERGYGGSFQPVRRRPAGARGGGRVARTAPVTVDRVGGGGNGGRQIPLQLVSPHTAGSDA